MKCKMIRKFFLTIFILAFAVPGWSYTETFYACSGGNGTLPETNACATAYDADDLDTAGNYDIDDQDDGKIGPNDLVIIKDDGGIFRATDELASHASGLSGKPITFQAEGGDSPVFSGADLITTWTQAYEKEETGGVFASGLEDEVDAFTTDFTGETNEGSNALSVQSTTKNSGDDAAEGTFDGTNEGNFAYKTFSNQTDLYVRIYFYLSADFAFNDAWSSIELLRIEDGGVMLAVIKLQVGAGGNAGWNVRGYIGGTDLGATAADSVSVATWHYIELRWLKGTGADGGGEFWLDGVSKGSNYTLDETGNDADRIEVGSTDGGFTQPTATSELYFDDVKADTSGIGVVSLPVITNVFQAACTFTTDSVWEDDTFLTRETTLAAVDAAGEFYLDDAGDLLYVWATDDADPDTHTMEAGNRQNVWKQNSFSGGEHDYITLEGLIFEKNWNSQFIVWFDACENIILDTITVRRSGKSSTGVKFSGGTDNTVVDSTVHDLRNGPAIAIRSTSPNGIIRRNTIYNIGQNSVSGEDKMAIDIGGSGGNCDNSVIEYNHIYNIGQAVADLSHTVVVDDSDGVILRYNKIHDTVKGGIFVVGTAGTPISGVSIYYNLIYSINKTDQQHDGVSAGIGLIDVDDALVYNNLIWNTGSYGALDAGIYVEVSGANTQDGTKIKNNIIGPSLGSNRKQYFRDAGTYTNYESDYNQFYDSAGLNFKNAGDTYNSLANWQAGVSLDANSDDSDPKLTNPGNDDFTLQSSSPTIDAGTDLGATYDDGLDPDSTWVSGVTTLDQDLHGNDWEIGAYIYQTIWRWGD